MKEIRMAVVNEDEAIEYCREHNLEFVTCYRGDISDPDEFMMLAIDHSTNKTNEPLSNDEIKQLKELFPTEFDENDTVIFCIIGENKNKLYLSEHKVNGIGTTFKLNEAKRFKASEAKEKVAAMNRHYRHHWMCLKLTS